LAFKGSLDAVGVALILSMVSITFCVVA